jgi:hydrogenase expression/formation protein HypE
VTEPKDFSLSCPVPAGDGGQILMAHGGGGKVMADLIEKVFMPAFDSAALRERHDASVVTVEGTRLAFTTDSFVVHPLFFPGGDIGSLAVNGTVNDLAMAGAKPMFLSAGFILEEGLPIETLSRVAASMGAAAKAAGVQFVTGDTKVVDRGKGDGVYVNTAGIGLVEGSVDVAPRRVRPGDAVIVSGDLGRHGMAVMALRESLEFQSAIESDCAPLWTPVEALLKGGIDIHCLRDLTRGGLSAALNEIAAAAKVNVRVEEAAIPVREDVRAACEILGLDPLYAANEGRFVAFVPKVQAEKAVAILRAQPVSQGACRIGEISDTPGSFVTLRTALGADRALDLLSGEQMPRIC